MHGIGAKNNGHIVEVGFRCLCDLRLERPTRMEIYIFYLHFSEHKFIPEAYFD
jgi:hypothetical protein